MLDPTQEVQGIAVYVEFRKESMGAVATSQFIITPDGYRTDGLFVPASLYRRAVDRWSPKRQWRSSFISTQREPSESLPTYGTDEERIAHGDERLDRAVNLLRQMGVSGTAYDGSSIGWTLVGEPLFIEVSKRDLDDVSAHKTPSKVVYRIGQTRTAKKFPDTLYA